MGEINLLEAMLRLEIIFFSSYARIEQKPQTKSSWAAMSTTCCRNTKNSFICDFKTYGPQRIVPLPLQSGHIKNRKTKKGKENFGNQSVSLVERVRISRKNVVADSILDIRVIIF